MKAVLLILTYDEHMAPSGWEAGWNPKLLLFPITAVLVSCPTLNTELFQLLPIESIVVTYTGICAEPKYFH
jgi:hypothetical protein